MRAVRWTLLADGPGDRVLIHVLSWVLETNSPRAFQPAWASPDVLPHTRAGLLERINAALSLYPCDLLFVHRDAEGASRTQRVREIETALGEAAGEKRFPAICVVPVRMQEAWFLFDETALRRAAGNPTGRVVLELPALDRVERIADPKTVLHQLLRDASELKGRRRNAFNARVAAHRLAQLIRDYSPLRRLDAFRQLETDVSATLAEHGWN